VALVKEWVVEPARHYTFGLRTVYVLKYRIECFGCRVCECVEDLKYIRDVSVTLEGGENMCNASSQAHSQALTSMTPESRSEYH
jgi:hypothetical protein